MGSFEFCSSPSPSPSRPGWAYDVFLSFRGEDTRKNFTDHLYSALIQAGIRTFRDNDELPRGEDISSHILKAIQESKISIVVFSEGYASSTWCLDELVKILDCKRTTGQIVLPVFYHIDPSHVRRQKTSFAEAFGRYEERFKDEIEKVNKWKGALVEAANLSGWDLYTVANGHESEFIKKIVEEVSSKLNPRYMKVATYPVGIDSQVNDIIVSLDVGLDDVRILGIYGMPGIGKTAMAKALFNQLCCKFEGSCLLNIKNIAEQPNGLVQLQEQRLCDTLKQKLWIRNVDVGINLIKKRFSQKRVLIVLDDLDHLKQVNALVGERSWFGCGSRIIITTRDERLLTQLEVDKKYQAKELNPEESLQLFSRHAFREKPHPKDYFELSKKVVDYASGLPLALEVLGAFLSGRSISEWSSAIDKLQKIPHDEIQSHLRTSYDSLGDDKLKDMFLDIACFFIGKKKDYVAKILDGRGFFSEIGLSILIERSLVTIDNQNDELKMHDLLRDMGREIVREKSPKDLGRRSRLWCDEEVLKVLKWRMGTEVVEGLILDVEASKQVALSTESFAKMNYLQLLQCNGVHLNGYYEQLSQELTWLCWHKCPLQSLPPDFQLDNLVVLDMQYSDIEEVWMEIKFLNKLKIFNLSHSVYLVKTPNFTGVSSLESLILKGCRSLVEVHPSTGHLESLRVLNLEGCGKLKNLPESVYQLSSLETLNVAKCLSLVNLPQSLRWRPEAPTVTLGSALPPLAKAPARPLVKVLRPLVKVLRPAMPPKPARPRPAMRVAPPMPMPMWSMGSAQVEIVTKQIEIVPKFPPFLPASIVGLSSLRRLDLSGRHLSDVDISINLGTLSSLQDLNLAGNRFFNLPTGIGHLPRLERLNLCRCTNLQSILDLPTSLNTLVAYRCTSMEKLSIRSITVPDLLLSGSKKLVEIEGLDNVENKPVIYMANCKNLSNNFMKILLQVLSKGKLPDIVFPGSEVPDWFGHRGHGSSVSFYLPAISSSEIQGLIVWAVFASEFIEDESFFSANIRKKSNGTELFYTPSYFPMFSYHEEQHSWVIYIPFSQLACAVEVGEELEVSVKVAVNDTVRKCGVELAGSFGKPITSWN